MQLQIADKVRIEVAKAAIGGYQGQEPVVEPLGGAAERAGQVRIVMKNLRWKVITVLAVFVVFAAVGVYPIVAARYGIQSPGFLIDQQLKLGLDLKGGVHLVLRVQTDDALRLETEQEMERLRAELTDARHHRRRTSRARPDAFRRRRRPAGPGRRVPRRRPPKSRPNFDRSAGANGTYTFTMKPNVQVTLREEAVVQARQTIERRVNELGVTEPSIAQQGRRRSDPRPAARRHRRRAGEGDHRVDRVSSS